MLDSIAVSPTPSPVPAAAVFSLAERDEYGRILGRPGGLFTVLTLQPTTGARDPLERPVVTWVPTEHLL